MTVDEKGDHRRTIKPVSRGLWQSWRQTTDCQAELPAGSANQQRCWVCILSLREVCAAARKPKTCERALRGRHSHGVVCMGQTTTTRWRCLCDVRFLLSRAATANAWRHFRVCSGPRVQTLEGYTAKQRTLTHELPAHTTIIVGPEHHFTEI